MSTRTLFLGKASPADILSSVGELEPGLEYSVTISPARRISGEEAARRLEALYEKTEPDPALAGLSDDEVMDMVNAEIEAARREARDNPQSS